MRLIPAMDLRAGRCVRLLQGDFDAETRYDVDPRALLGKYRDCGADWLHVVDLDAARDGGRDSGGAGNDSLIAQLAAEGALHLQVGGGLRDAAAVARMLDLGAARAVIGSAAISHVDEVHGWLRRFGAEQLTLAFDVRLDRSGVPRVTTHGWREQSQISLWDAVANFAAAGLVHVLCTDVSRDGALSGPNVELYRNAVHRYPRLQWQASGGIRESRDLHALAGAGAAAAISGRALLEELIPLEELQAFLPNA
jgi:phosphoribosylformimino-5-aminoimidazole carboxamide ribotide isomerase